MNSEEQIQRNCEQIQELLDRHPDRNITVMRKAVDYCYVKEKESKQVIYTGETGETLQELRTYLEPIQEEIKIADANYKKIQGLIKEFPKNTIEVTRININYYKLKYKDERPWIYNTGATFVNLGDMLTYRVKREEKENKLLAESQALLDNSQYNWMKIRKTKYFERWEIIDTNHNDRVRFEGRADIVAKTVREITGNQ